MNQMSQRNEIAVGIKLQKASLDKGHFFEALLSKMVEGGYLSADSLQSIQMQLLELLTCTIEDYNAGKSSSIPTKKAEELMQSIYFSLGYYFEQLERLDESIPIIQTVSLKEIFKSGQEQIKERFKRLKGEYEQLMMQLLSTENIAYQDTYREGLDPFFKLYAPKFESHQIPCDIDYPLSEDIMDQVGIDYMASFIEKSLLEHCLCLKFEPVEIEGLLKNYDPGYIHLLVNIYELVLMNSVGRVLLGKSLESLKLEMRDIFSLEEKLEGHTKEEIESLLQKAATNCLEELKLTENRMRNYVYHTISKIAPHVKVELEKEALDQVFITDKTTQLQKVTYKGGKKLEDDAFKELAQRIRELGMVEDKVSLIKEKISDAEDLKDLLEADCLFEEEYEVLFESLSDIEMALLLSLTVSDEFGIISLEVDEEDKDWERILKSYLNEKEVAKAQEILVMAKRIEKSIDASENEK